jgi:hypothetical protein
VVAEFLHPRLDPFLVEVVGAAEILEILAIVPQGRVDETREQIGMDRFKAVQIHRFGHA